MVLEGQPEKSQKNKAEPSKPDTAYQKISSFEPLKDMELPGEGEEDDEAGHKTFGEKMEEAPNLSDMQTADKRMFPDLGYDHLNVIQVSRIFPDVYNALLRIQVKSLLRSALCKGKRLPVAEAIAYVNTAMSIAIDGEGRIDMEVMLGATKAEEEKKSEQKLLNM